MIINSKIPYRASKIRNSKFGFTLIELLVVISVIGILASLLLARFGTIEKSGRDARRKSDLNQYRTALEHYSISTNGRYPSFTSIVNAQQSLCTTLQASGQTYISYCPNDPRFDGTTYYYRYQSNGSGSPNIDATQYILWADIENGGYWYICSSGKIAEKIPTAGAPVTGDCGF